MLYQYLAISERDDRLDQSGGSWRCSGLSTVKFRETKQSTTEGGVFYL